jgi:hypothetical protein
MEKELQQIAQLQSDTVKLLVLLVKKGEIQQNLIHQFANVGFGTKRIADLLGTTANTVNVAIQKAKRQKKK